MEREIAAPCATSCPLCPNSGHRQRRRRMSALCHKRTRAPQQTTCTHCSDLLDHLGSPPR